MDSSVDGSIEKHDIEKNDDEPLVKDKTLPFSNVRIFNTKCFCKQYANFSKYFLRIIIIHQPPQLM